MTCSRWRWRWRSITTTPCASPWPCVVSRGLRRARPEEHRGDEQREQQKEREHSDDTAGGHGGSLPWRLVARWLLTRAGPLPRWLVVYLVLGAGAIAVSKLATGEIAGWSLYLLVSATPNLVESIRRYLAEQHAEEVEAAREAAALTSGIYVRQQQTTSRLRALERGDEE